MIQTIPAETHHEKEALILLDKFRDFCLGKIYPDQQHPPSRTAVENGSELFKSVISSNKSRIFLAFDNDQAIGIVTVHLTPQVRIGKYAAEIEEMYVLEEYQGAGVAKQLIDAVKNWVKTQNVKFLRLESAIELGRAHTFYEKAGFTHYGKAYICNMDDL